MAKRRALRAAAAVVGSAALLAAAPVPAWAQTAVSCRYDLTSWAGGFVAEVWITNNGPAINGWTVRWNFGAPTTVTSVWNAVLTQPEPSSAVATNPAWNGSIGSGQVASFGWSATTVGRATVPDTITLNGVAC